MQFILQLFWLRNYFTDKPNNLWEQVREGNQRRDGRKKEIGGGKEAEESSIQGKGNCIPTALKFAFKHLIPRFRDKFRVHNCLKIMPQRCLLLLNSVHILWSACLQYSFLFFAREIYCKHFLRSLFIDFLHREIDSVAFWFALYFSNCGKPAIMSWLFLQYTTSKNCVCFMSATTLCFNTR